MIKEMVFVTIACSLSETRAQAVKIQLIALNANLDIFKNSIQLNLLSAFHVLPSMMKTVPNVI
jgi:hypothetical protein